VSALTEAEHAQAWEHCEGIVVEQGWAWRKDQRSRGRRHGGAGGRHRGRAGWPSELPDLDDGDFVT
jgi:hypothetical protein